MGVLPRIIKTLVERRKNVETLLKQEKNADECKAVSGEGEEGSELRAQH